MRPSRAEVIAFRLAAHHLHERRGVDEMLAVAGACGVQDSPPGSALLALHARLRGLTREDVDRAVADRRLLRTWSVRGAPFVVPATSAPTFTLGVLPPTEEALRHFLPGVGPSLDRLGLTLGEAVDLTGAEVQAVLPHRRLTIDELGAEGAPRLGRALTKGQRHEWSSPGPYADGQPVGEGVVHFCVRVLALRGVVCFAPREGAKAPFVLLDEWLGGPLPPVDPVAARRELLRRYLHSYAPSTPAQFASWLGVHVGDVRPWWGLVEDDLTATDHGGRSWMLTDDLDALRAARMPRGVRLLPPSDPYTQSRDRDTIVPPGRQREVWRATGSPGTALVDGEVVGTWRSHLTGSTSRFEADLFETLTPEGLDELRQEGDRIALLRGASSATVELGEASRTGAGRARRHR